MLPRHLAAAAHEVEPADPLLRLRDDEAVRRALQVCGGQLGPRRLLVLLLLVLLHRLFLLLMFLMLCCNAQPM